MTNEQELREYTEEELREMRQKAAAYYKEEIKFLEIEVRFHDLHARREEAILRREEAIAKYSYLRLKQIEAQAMAKADQENKNISGLNEESNSHSEQKPETGSEEQNPKKRTLKKQDHV